ncbi:hypothetical protein [Paenibacillus odorifer]|uniref:hypothetical protein n=1 Tax=Paenibacillus odorifer TaxID=189426 RepID=UPI00096C8CB9|nr:hypothetical protein [Paenibacillus odorifer]OMD10706.1 hypothetical protein BJP50_27985 [Paenibacillus odorifer]
MKERRIVFSDHAIERMTERVFKYNQKYKKTATIEEVTKIIINDANRIKRTLNDKVKRYTEGKEPRVKYMISDSIDTRVIITVSGLYNNDRIKQFTDNDIGVKSKSFSRIKKNHNKKYRSKKIELGQNDLEEVFEL